MKSAKNNNLITSLMLIVLGIMFCIFQGGVITIALTIMGIVSILMAIIDFSNKSTTLGIIKAVVGVCIIVFGWMFVDLALYIIAALMIIYGLLQIVSAVKEKSMYNSAQKAIACIKPVASLVAGICLLFNKNGMVDWIFIVIGILLVIDGILSLTDVNRNY